MNITTTRILCAFSLTALSCIAAHASGEGDNAPERARPFQSTVTVEQVKSQARMPVIITNGGTGFIGVTHSGVQPAQVRAQAAMATRDGTAPRGELGTM